VPLDSITREPSVTGVPVTVGSGVLSVDELLAQDIRVPAMLGELAQRKQAGGSAESRARSGDPDFDLLRLRHQAGASLMAVRE
jgi:hypothetical protein